MSFISSRIIEGVNRLVRCANLKAVGFMSEASCCLLNTPSMHPKSEATGFLSMSWRNRIRI
jgi:hypothetical protein